MIYAAVAFTSSAITMLFSYYVIKRYEQRERAIEAMKELAKAIKEMKG